MQSDDRAAEYIGRMKEEGVCYNLCFPLSRSLPRHVTLLDEDIVDDDDDGDDDDKGNDIENAGNWVDECGIAGRSIYSLHNSQFVQRSNLATVLRGRQS